MAIKTRVLPFTLIEMLAAIGIVLVLMGLAIGGIQAARRVARESKGKARIVLLEKGINAYFQKWGFYPHPTQSSLLAFVVSGDAMQTLFEIPKTDRKITTSPPSYYVADPCNTDVFYYRVPGTFNPTTFDLGSKGLNGKWGADDVEANMGKDDDIVNFKRSR